MYVTYVDSNDDRIELEIVIESSGYRASGPSYSSAGEPSEGPKFRIVRAVWHVDHPDLGRLPPIELGLAQRRALARFGVVVEAVDHLRAWPA